MTPTPLTDVAILYCRVSTEEQGDTGASLDAQEARLRAEATKRGLTPHVIRDVASGKNLKRDGITEALAMLKRREAGYLIAVRNDRISRDVHDFTGLMKTADRQRWAIVLLDLNIDTSDPFGESALINFVNYSQLERRLIGRRTKEAMAHIRETTGKHMGRRRTLPNEVVARIHTEREAGQGWSAIARGLEADNIPTSTGKTVWHPATVKRTFEAITPAP